jgi:hypothetical protein
MKKFNLYTPAVLLVAWSVALSGCVGVDSGNGEPVDIQVSKAVAAEDSQLLHEPEIVVADDSHAIFNAMNALGAANYESGWTTVSSSSQANIVFNNGFLPRVVSVLVQMHDCSGNWVDRYTYIPPAHSSWDDAYTNGENVYWVENDSIVVHHEGVIRGTNVHDGCSFQRFKVYAWR